MTPWGGRQVAALAEAVIARDGLTCWLCRHPVDPLLPRLHPKAYTVDHVKPRSKGGTNDLDNLRLAHRRCNTIKGARTGAPVRPPEDGAGWLRSGPSG